MSKLSPYSQKDILDYLYNHVQQLEHPRQLGKALVGDLKGLWRYRVDKFRVICEIQDDKLVVIVLRIGARDSIYYK